ncbi:hypothetical protein H9P43_007737 [Blastocladiella emersonii ATCC 22665]|nr:hypothetical protein H9P43_007737 [Blastocladiella emersonii ATCC 22665]
MLIGGFLAALLLRPSKAGRPWLLALVLSAAGLSATAYWLHTVAFPAIRAYLAAITELHLARVKAHAELAKLRSAQAKYLAAAAAAAARALADTRSVAAAARSVTVLPPPPPETTPTVSGNYPLPPNDVPNEDPALELMALTRDWLGHAAAAAASASASGFWANGSGSLSATSGWRMPTTATTVLGTDIAAGVREAAEACRSECRMVKSALVTRRLPRGSMAMARFGAGGKRATVLPGVAGNVFDQAKEEAGQQPAVAT